MRRENEPHPPLHPPGLEGPAAWDDVPGQVASTDRQVKSRLTTGTPTSAAIAAALEAQHYSNEGASFASRRAAILQKEAARSPPALSGSVLSSVPQIYLPVCEKQLVLIPPNQSIPLSHPTYAESPLECL